MTQQTPLHALHMDHGAKMVEFAGWQMPVSYPLGVLGEHNACREGAAIFDVSHMGQVELRGDDVAQQLETLVPGGITTLKPGKCRYTQFTNDTGGILDDLIISNAGDHYSLVVNASMREQDLDHLRSNLQGIDITERTDLALIALQGPAAGGILQKLAPKSEDLSFMEAMEVQLLGVTARVSRLGYTGEDGFEISILSAKAIELAEALLNDAKFAGLGARDSLRLEAGLCLYGNDIDPLISPVEAGLNWSIPKRRREEGGFPGAERILRELNDGPARKLVGIRPDGRAPARAGVPIEVNGTKVGEITSGGFGPSIGAPISMGYVASEFANSGTKIDLLIRGKAQPGMITPLPFYPHNYKR